MTEPSLSVVLCTHNPRGDFLARTVKALLDQSLPASEWELLLVDNASDQPVSGMLEIPAAHRVRLLSEPKLGLTAARLRGFAESRSNLIVCVDDDNVLAPDYLSRAKAIGDRFTSLGVWGCGSYTPEWEQAPDSALAPYLQYLAVQAISEDRRSNRPGDFAAMPAGAGMCIRAIVAQRYLREVSTDPRRLVLGRTGTSLSACEDMDLSNTATDLGMEMGVFRELAMTHLMPKSRVEEAYLQRLVEGHASSTVLMMGLRDATFRMPRRTWIGRLREWRYLRSIDPVQRRIHLAKRRGEIQGWELLGRLRSANAAAPS